MKFEQVLHLYWTNHFLFNGRINNFNVTLYNLFKNVGGLQKTTKYAFIFRFELTTFLQNSKKPLNVYPRAILRAINILLSQLSTVNNQITEITKLSIVRLYLLKTFRGRAQAIGKPSHGQRTWSNAWSAYNSNRILRDFISTMQKILKKNYKEEKVDYRRLARKYKKKNLQDVSAKKAKKLTMHWF